MGGGGSEPRTGNIYKDICRVVLPSLKLYGCFPRKGVSQNGWFIMENPVKWMIWGTSIFGNIHVNIAPEIPDVQKMDPFLRFRDAILFSGKLAVSFRVAQRLHQILPD